MGRWFGGGADRVVGPVADGARSPGERRRSPSSTSSPLGRLRPGRRIRPDRRRLARLPRLRRRVAAGSGSTTHCALATAATGWWFESSRAAGPGGRRRGARRSPGRRAWLTQPRAPADDQAGPLTGPFARRPADAATDHLAAVESVIGRIDRGDFYQLNLCTRLRRGSSRRRSGAARIFAEVGRAAAARRTAAWLDLGDGRSLVVSLSPELFLRVRGGRVADRADQGHQPAQPRTRRAPCCAASAKDAAENVMIIDLMRNDLSRVCRPGTRGGGAAARPRARTPGSGTWCRRWPVQLRPGVEPRRPAARHLPAGLGHRCPEAQRAWPGSRRPRREPRGAYTGALGLVTPSAGAEFSVIIRTFEIDGDAIELGVGGGITVDSVPDPGVVRVPAQGRARWCTRSGAALAPELGEPPPPVPDALRDGRRDRDHAGPGRRGAPAGRAPGPAGPLLPGAVRPRPARPTCRRTGSTVAARQPLGRRPDPAARRPEPRPSR